MLYGAALALGGDQGFAYLGLSPELGARALGVLLADHRRAQELRKSYVPIIAAGCDVSYNYYTEAGVGFARHTYETLTTSAPAIPPPDFE